jgi:4-coumarate--CoA ligase
VALIVTLTTDFWWQGVALSARNMISNALQVHHVQNLSGHSLGLLPFFHIYALMLFHLSIYQGAAKVILPRFEPESFLGTLEKYKVSSETCFAHVDSETCSSPV